MPELPEVETIRRDLNKELKGRKIIKLKFYDWPNMLKPSPEAIAKAIKGKKIQDFGRRAKLLLMHLSADKAGLDDHGTTIAIHLKMTGQLFIRKQTDPPDRFTHVILELGSGEELRFNDLRKFGFMKLIKNNDELKELLSGYGPEPLTADFTLAKFKEIVGKSARAIKIVIMDQQKIAGVGNIYADEALWIAKTHPEKPANELDKKELKYLFEAIEFVIKQGIEDRGTSVDNYFDVQGNKGNHAQNLKVFRQDKKPCPRCKRIIEKIKVGGRGTHFCPKCQILNS